ncbi:hypothetical protein PC128_g9049 [Phytophthora cactorum]|nr:hypothetical protein PC128_g9049 [Phytophthora cactorum]
MRVLLWLLLVSFTTLLASSDAASATTSDKKQLLSLDIKLLSRALNVNNEKGKRFLRAGSKETVAIEDEDERGIVVLLEMFFARIKAKIQRVLIRRFEKLDTQNITPGMLAKNYQIGTLAALARNKRFIKLYTAWYQEKHPT